MDAILSFFSDLILFTSGLFVMLLWIVIFMVMGIEAHDFMFGEPEKEEEDL